MLSSPSENRLVSVISYQFVNVDVADFELLDGSLVHDLSQWDVVAGVIGVEDLKLMIGNSGVGVDSLL